MENLDILPPTAPSLVFARETYTPYSSGETNPAPISTETPSHGLNNTTSEEADSYVYNDNTNTTKRCSEQDYGIG